MLKHLCRRRLWLHQERHREIVLPRQPRPDKARIGHLHPDPRPAQIGIQAFGQGHHPRLARRIAQGPRQPAKARQRPGQHHMPRPPRDHPRQNRADDPRAAGEIHVAHRDQFGRLDPLRRHRPIDRRQPDDPIHRPDLPRRPRDRCRIRHIQRHKFRPRHRRTGLGQLVRRPRRQDHLRPRRVHLACQGQPQPFGRAHEPIAPPGPDHAATRRIVATSSPTVMPHLENRLRFMIVPFSIR